MDTKTTSRLNELYLGIIAYSKVSCPWFGVIDFAGLAASAINLLIQRGEIGSWEKRECSRYMVDLFNRDLGGSMPQSVVDEVVNYMAGYTDIDQNLAGILAAIEMSR